MCNETNKSLDNVKYDKPRFSFFVGVWRIIQYLCSFVPCYVLIEMTCKLFIPIISGIFVVNMGITYDSHYLDVISLYLLPIMFAIGMLFLVEWNIMKKYCRLWSYIVNTIIYRHMTKQKKNK